MPHGDVLPGPAFRQRAPWWGGDLQTLRNSLLPDPAPLPGERVFIPMDDGTGDQLCGLLNRGADEGGTLIVLVHGLSGHEASSYMTIIARQLSLAGYATVRLNMRGAGFSRAHCRQHYHAGRSEDLRRAIEHLCAMGDWRDAVLVGFSLGGNIALKCAAEAPVNGRLAGVVSVSAPIDLAHTSRHMLSGRSWLYHQALLRPFKREVLRMRGLTGAEAEAVRGARTFLELDDRFVAPRNGFASAWDYYARSMALQFVDAIALPGLIIHALDDPIVPPRAYLKHDWRRNKRLQVRLLRHGGHVGFHRAGGPPWYVGETLGFLHRLTGRPSVAPASSTR